MAGNPATDGSEWMRYAQQLADEIRKRRGGALDENTAERLALIEGLSSAFRQYPADWILFKAIIAARLTTLLYLEGEKRAAYQTAEDAITLAGQVRSARLADDLRVLIRTLPTRDGADEHARDLGQRLSTVLAEMT